MKYGVVVLRDSRDGYNMNNKTLFMNFTGDCGTFVTSACMSTTSEDLDFIVLFSHFHHHIQGKKKDFMNQVLKEWGSEGKKEMMPLNKMQPYIFRHCRQSDDAPYSREQDSHIVHIVD